MNQSNRRVLFYHAEFPSGGGERVTKDIAKAVAASGYEVYVVTCHKKEGNSSEVTLIELPDTNVDSIVNADAIVNLIGSLSIDIFVLPGFLWKYLGYVKQRVHCKFIYILHNIPLWEIVAKVERRKRMQGSLLKILEWYFISYPKIVWFKKYEKQYLKSYKETYNLVDSYVVLCDAYKTEMEQTFGLSSESKLCVIHNAEDTVEDINWKDKKKQIVFVGNMIYENKRVDRLLEIWKIVYKKVPDWELILVGGGQEKNNLEKDAAKMGLQRISFVGGTQDVQPFYRSASVFCLTSTFEGWPLCLTEAQANGVVPIAFDCCAGIREILSPSGINGILVPPFDLDAFANALYLLLTSDDAIIQMRDNVVIKSHAYSLEMVGKRWVELFDSL